MFPTHTHTHTISHPPLSANFAHLSFKEKDNDLCRRGVITWRVNTPEDKVASLPPGRENSFSSRGPAQMLTGSEPSVSRWPAPYAFSAGRRCKVKQCISCRVAPEETKGVKRVQRRCRRDAWGGLPWHPAGCRLSSRGRLPDPSPWLQVWRLMRWILNSHMQAQSSREVLPGGSPTPLADCVGSFQYVRICL